MGARLEISNGDEEYEVVPVLFYDGTGKRSEPATFQVNSDGMDQEASVILNELNANEKLVELHFTGLESDAKTAQPQEQLLLEVSKKPFMNILWFGTVLIVLGAIISLKRRTSETF